MTVINSPASRAIAYAGASALIAASASFGAFYAFGFGSHHHVALGVLLAGAALGGELLKPLAVVSAVDAVRARDVARSVAAVALAAVCFVYSLASALSLAAGSRGDGAAARDAAASAARSARAAIHRAETELDSLAPARPVAELAPQILALKNRPGANGCVKIDGPVSREACAEAAALEAEAGRAERRAELEGIVAANAAPPAGAGAVSDADPLAAVVASYAAAMGRPWTAEGLAPWLALIPVLFLEIGSALALLVARGIGAPGAAPRVLPPSEAPADGASLAGTAAGPLPSLPAPLPLTAAPLPLDAPPAEAAATQDAAACEATARGAPRKPRDVRSSSNPVHVEMLGRLRKSGGTVQGSQRGLAKGLGISKSTMNRALGEMQAAGLVRVQASAAGTVVTLA